jgi:glyoxylase-like metal-dependent hydrolase (beta-lactamase superfamily II)
MNSEQVESGVWRLGTMWANFYVVADGDAAILVGAGYPRYYGQLESLLGSRELPVTRIEAAIVTHHHVDHAGTGEEVRSKLGATILVHPADAARVRGEHKSHPPQGFYRSSWRLNMIRYLAHTVRAGGASYRAVHEYEPLTDRETLDLPGRPRIIFTPGHTAGHCSVLLEDRGVLFAGDAMVNFDYPSGRRGVALHRFNEDRAQALESLARLEDVEAETVLFGHGDPWRGGARRAVELAREAR